MQGGALTCVQAHGGRSARWWTAWSRRSGAGSELLLHLVTEQLHGRKYSDDLLLAPVAGDDDLGAVVAAVVADLDLDDIAAMVVEVDRMIHDSRIGDERPRDAFALKARLAREIAVFAGASVTLGDAQARGGRGLGGGRQQESHRQARTPHIPHVYIHPCSPSHIRPACHPKIRASARTGCSRVAAQIAIPKSPRDDQKSDLRRI